MDLLVPLVLLVAAFFFAQAGMQFFTFLLLVAAVLAFVMGAFGGEKKPKGVVYEQGGAIVVDNRGPEIPETIKVKVKPDWGDVKMHKKSSMKLGESVNVVGKTITRFVFGKKKA